MASSPITSWQIDGETMETVRDLIFLMMAILTGPITSWQIYRAYSGNSDRLYFLGLQNHCGW